MDNIKPTLLSDKIDLKAKKLLARFFVIVFITTIFGSLVGYYEFNGFKIGGWLINYQAGFIRRGFIGEILYWISRLSGINPGLLVSIAQIILYGIFFRVSFLLLKQKGTLLPYVILIVSPTIFIFQIVDLQGGFRKEVIFFAMLSILVWYSARDERSFLRCFYFCLATFPFLILSHEMLAIYLPYPIIVFLIKSELTTKRFLLIGFLLLISVVSFISVLYYSGDANKAEIIASSIHELGYLVDSGGYIEWLGNDVTDSFKFVKESIFGRLYFLYIVLIGLALIAYLPVLDRVKLIFRDKLVRVLFIISIIGTAVLLIVANDWGRYLYVHLVSLFLILLMPELNCDQKYQNKVRNFINSRTPKVAIIFVIIFSSFWHLPHCCRASTGFTSPLKIIEGTLGSYGRVVMAFNPELHEKVIKLEHKLKNR